VGAVAREKSQNKGLGEFKVSKPTRLILFMAMFILVGTLLVQTYTQLQYGQESYYDPCGACTKYTDQVCFYYDPLFKRNGSGNETQTQKNT